MPFDLNPETRNTKGRKRGSPEINRLRESAYDELIKAITKVIMPELYEREMADNLFKDEIDSELMSLVDKVKDHAFSNKKGSHHSLNFLFDRLIGKPQMTLNLGSAPDNLIEFKFPKEKEINPVEKDAE